jgi:hypothetical protein
MKRSGAEAVGDADADFVSAEREMDELAESGVAEILGSENVVGFR